MRSTAMILVAALASLGACGNGEESHDHEKSESGGAGHEEQGPHGGELIELGDHLAHLEAVHDVDAGTITLYALDTGLKPTALATVPVLNLPTSSGPKQVVGTARGGSASEWVFSDPALKAEPEGARLRIVFDGVTYTPELPHGHGH